MTSKQGSRIISTTLSPALRLWLRSQVSQVENLQFKISGGDRQILTGYIPQVFIAANHAVYQGLHLSRIQLTGENIRINLGQVLRGKPLRLLEPIPVSGELILEETDLKASLQAPLFATALTDLLGTLLQAVPTHPADILKDQQISWQQITIDPECLKLSGTLTDPSGKATPLVLRTGLKLASPHELLLESPCIETQKELLRGNLDEFKIDLGSEVDIQELTVILGQLVCRGRINVIPAE
ncbi:MULTISPECIES: DUF2993 domain-containing protein [unclassified Coleofasciculus]|uniref:LmeA family phospholipid-binding protein n=1 Tax=Cyanophyceae TaxID=3028117 RepID=UPI001686DE46|nr:MULTISPECIES: DUF2993 domain-containing protein [unclassified Coleofasciculus]MBD2088004.1 DUF2993 domain-containing protein [Coleofasciculus sp. FACHB-542]MBD2538111.1 DUF2993 domain-containing protein [Coleofasciculus sp. FACHB-SPT36]